MRKGKYILSYQSFFIAISIVLLANSSRWMSNQCRKMNTKKQFLLIFFGLFLIASNIYPQNVAFENHSKDYYKRLFPSIENRIDKEFLENEMFMPQSYRIHNNNNSDSTSLISEVIGKLDDGSEINYTYTYDSKGNQTLALYRTWDGSQWVNNSRTTSNYDTNGNITFLLFETWDDTNNQWVGDGRYNITYDSNGNITSYMFEEWDGSKWVDDGRYTTTYDSNGNMTSNLSESWDGTQWVNNSRTTYTYDSNGNQTSYTYERWDGSQWENNNRITYTNDSNGNQTSNISERWDGTQWVNNSRTNYTYNSNGNQTSYTYERWDGSQWVDNSRITSTYDSNGNETSNISERWDGSQWVNNSRITSTYDSNGNQTSNFSERWDGSQWVNNSRITYTYDSNSNMIFASSEKWESNNWVVSNGSFSFEDSFGRIQFYFASEINVSYLILDVEAPVIEHNPVLLVETSQTPTITADIVDEGVISNAKLFYRKGGEINFDSLTMTANGNSYNSIIPSNKVTLNGLEYYLSATDASGNLRRVPENGVISVQVSIGGDGLVKETAQPNGSSQTTYRLISFPLDIDNKNSAAIFDDDLGNYDKTKWRMFELGDEQTYKENSSSLSINSGSAYWLIVKDSDKKIDTGPAKSFRTNTPFTISLSAGWNFIGNPFNFLIPVENLSLANNQNFILDYYSGSWNPFAGSIQPFEGYAIHTEQATTLVVNPVLSSSSLTKATNDKTTKSVWEINIVASCQNAIDGNNIVALIPESSRDWDNHDRPEPPVIGDYISLYFPHNDWGKISESYSKDARPDIADGDIWDIEVRTNVNDIVNLSFENLTNLPPNYEINLVDHKIDLVKDLKISSMYQFNNSTSDTPRRMKLIIGDKEFVRNQTEKNSTTPSIFQLFQNFPNPFNPTTKIIYSIPSKGTAGKILQNVKLQIYDVLGREIVTLVNEKKEPGNYEVKFDASNLISGIYFYTLEAGSYRSTKKMLLLK